MDPLHISHVSSTVSWVLRAKPHPFWFYLIHILATSCSSHWWQCSRVSSANVSQTSPSSIFVSVQLTGIENLYLRSSHLHHEATECFTHWCWNLASIDPSSCYLSPIALPTTSPPVLLDFLCLNLMPCLREIEWYSLLLYSYKLIAPNVTALRIVRCVRISLFLPAPLPIDVVCSSSQELWAMQIPMGIKVN